MAFEHQQVDIGAVEASVAPTRPVHLHVDWSKIGLTPTRLQFIAELVSEFIGIYLLILVGDSSSSMALLFSPSPYLTAYWGVCITWGLAVTFAIYGTGGVSGCHINPAVTLSFALFRGFPWWKVVPYIIAQWLGAFVGAYSVYSMYFPIFTAYLDSNHVSKQDSVTSSESFFTSVNEHLTNYDGFIGQIYQTGILLYGIFAVTDPYNPNSFSHNGLKALLIGYVVAMVGGGFGFLEGFAINPARDFGPRVAAYSLGWGKMAFPGFHNYWWGPICGPLIGGPVGAFIYEAFNRPFMPGVQAHGDTPLMKAWSRLVVGLFPKLATYHSDDESATQKAEISVEERFHDHHHRGKHAMMDVGPGGTAPHESGIEGVDMTL